MTAECDDCHVARREVQVAAVGPRAIAVVIDSVVLAILAGIPLVILLGHRTVISRSGSSSVNYSSSNPLVFLAWCAVAIVYFSAFEATTGATLGKLILHLRVRDESGAPIGWQRAVVRNLLRMVDAFPYVVPYLVGATFAWTSPRRQRTGDLAAHTLVVVQPVTPWRAVEDLGAEPAWPVSVPPTDADEHWDVDENGKAFASLDATDDERRFRESLDQAGPWWTRRRRHDARN